MGIRTKYCVNHWRYSPLRLIGRFARRYRPELPIHPYHVFLGEFAAARSAPCPPRTKAAATSLQSSARDQCLDHFNRRAAEFSVRVFRRLDELSALSPKPQGIKCTVTQ